MSSFSTIACCLCGKAIIPNDAAMCIECLRGQVDITEGISRQCEMTQCKKCDRWLTQKDTWTHHELESPSLLSVCLKKVGGLSKTKLIDAFWVWTEPHSRRLRIGIDVEKSVLDGKAELRQRLEVEYVIQYRQCLECIRTATDHSWGAMVQLRQRGSESRSLLALETALTKAGLHNLMLGIEVVKYGLDFFFKHKNQAEKVISFITSLLPSRVKTSKKLVSADRKSNKQKYEHVYVVDVVPLAKGDLVLLPREGRRPSELILVEKVSSNLHFVSPWTSRRTEVSAAKYFSSPVQAVMLPRQLVRFVVLDVEAVNNVSGNPTDSCNETLAEVEVARESDFGVNDTTFRVNTHIGHLLSAGDIALGYDLQHSTLTDMDGVGLGESALAQDIVIVKKGFSESSQMRCSNEDNKEHVDESLRLKPDVGTSVHNVTQELDEGNGDPNNIEIRKVEC